jgi:hypothetical protein
MTDNTPETRTEALYETVPPNQSRQNQAILANQVTGTHTFGESGIPQPDKEAETDEYGIPLSAPRIWSPELHSKLFPRDDLTPKYIREFISEYMDNGVTAHSRVLRIPADSEDTTDSWCSYTQFNSPKIVGNEKRFYEFWAANCHPMFEVEINVDYSLGQVHITVEDKSQQASKQH